MVLLHHVPDCWSLSHGSETMIHLNLNRHMVINVIMFHAFSNREGACCKSEFTGNTYLTTNNMLQASSGAILTDFTDYSVPFHLSALGKAGHANFTYPLLRVSQIYKCTSIQEHNLVNVDPDIILSASPSQLLCCYASGDMGHHCSHGAGKLVMELDSFHDFILIR